LKVVFWEKAYNQKKAIATLKRSQTTLKPVMSLALSSAQENLAKACSTQGTSMNQTDFFEYLIENYSGAEFTLDDLAQDEDLKVLITPPKAEKSKKSTRGAKSSVERTNEAYDESRCDCRVFLNGFGGQCTHKKIEDTCMCKHHGEDGKWSNLRDEDGNWWLGFVTGPRPENPVRPGGGGKPKVWKTTEDGEVIEKPEKVKKPKMTDEEKEQKAAEKEALKEKKKQERDEKKKQKDEEKEQKKAEKEQKKAEKEQKKSGKDEGIEDLKKAFEEAELEEDTSANASDTEDMSDAGEEEQDSEYSEISYEGVEYQQHTETGEVLDPEDFSVMGIWNADTESIDWEDKDAEDTHKEKKSKL
jgi:hypothetical protein